MEVIWYAAFFLLFLCALIAFSVSVRPAHANPVLRIVVGSTAEKVMYGIAEKSMVRYANKTAMEKARERWNMELYEELMAQTTPVEVKQRLENFSQAVNNAEVIPIPERPGYGKVLLDAALFLTGLDIIFEAYHAFKTAYEQGKYADGLSDAIATGTYVKIWPGWELYAHKSENCCTDWRLRYISNPSDVSLIIPVIDGYAHLNSQPFDWYFEVTSVTTDYIYYDFHYNYYHPEYGRQIGVRCCKSLKKFYLTDDPVRTAILVSQSDVPDISEVPAPIAPLAEPGIDPAPQVEGLPEQVEIVIPISDPYPEPGGEPLNNPDDLFEPSPEPNPNPNPEPNPEPNPNPEPSPESGLDLTPLTRPISGLKEKFPFSIPWDLYHLVSFLDIPPKPPKFKVDVEKDVLFLGHRIPVEYKFDLDFAGFDWIAKIFRWGLIVIFDISLILALRRFTPD